MSFLSPQLSSASLHRPDVVLTPEERHIYGQLYRKVDVDSKGYIESVEAIPFFQKSLLPASTLAEIWTIAVQDVNGNINQQSFSAALKLIAFAQKGIPLDSSLLTSTDSPLPKFDGVVTEPYRSPPSSGIAQAFSSGLDDKTMTIKPEDRAKYLEIFQRAQPVGGVLDGERARTILMQSKLPLETLGQIWNLADIRKAGSLNSIEFVIALHFIQRTMDGSLKKLPLSLPPALYTSATGGVPPLNTRPTSPTQSPAAPIVRQFTGQAPHSSSPLQRQVTGTGGSIISPLVRQSTGNSTGIPPSFTLPNADRNSVLDFFGNAAIQSNGLGISDTSAVSTEEKAKYDRYFDAMDTARSGFLSGNDAVKFFVNSGLPEPDLAHIWDLADSVQRGSLNRDEFAIAMYLIQKRRNGETLPKSLPPNILPQPERRGSSASSTASVVGASAFSDLKRPPQRNDLAFSLSPQRTGSIPLQTSSSFNILSPQLTGSLSTGSTGSAGKGTKAPSQSQSLLDDSEWISDFENQQKLSNDSNELASLQQQTAAIAGATTELRQKRTAIDQSLQSLEAQKKDLSARLNHVKTLYDIELKMVQEQEQTLLREQAAVAQARDETMEAERKHAAVAQEKEQLQLQIQQCRAEAEELRKRARLLDEEARSMREQLKALQRDGKQAEAMREINRRQVLSAENDLAKVEKKLEGDNSGTINNGDDDLTRSLSPENPFESLSRSATPASLRPGALSPEGSTNQLSFPETDTSTSVATPASNELQNIDMWTSIPSPTLEKVKPPVPADPIRRVSGTPYKPNSPVASGATTPTSTISRKAPPPPPSRNSGTTSANDPFAEFSRTFEAAKKPKNTDTFNVMEASTFESQFPAIEQFNKQETATDPSDKTNITDPATTSDFGFGDDAFTLETKKDEPKSIAHKEGESTDTPIHEAELKFPDVGAIESKDIEISQEQDNISTPKSLEQKPEEKQEHKPEEKQEHKPEEIEFFAEPTTVTKSTPASFMDDFADFGTTNASTSSKPSSSAAIQDEFEAAFKNLSSAKVVSEPLDFDTAFDASFDDEFNPTFDAPKSTAPSFTNTSIVQSTNSSTAAAGPFDPSKFDFSDFGSTSVSKVPAAPSNLDDVFGGSVGNRASINGFTGFEDSFASVPTASLSNKRTSNPFGMSPITTPKPSSAATNDRGFSPVPEFESAQLTQPNFSTPSSTGQLPSPSTAPDTSQVNENDPPAVKEIVGMGFTRKQAIEALEKYDYNAEKAINYIVDNPQ